MPIYDPTVASGIQPWERGKEYKRGDVALIAGKVCTCQVNVAPAVGVAPRMYEWDEDIQTAVFRPSMDNNPVWRQTALDKSQMNSQYEGVKVKFVNGAGSQAWKEYELWSVWNRPTEPHSISLYGFKTDSWMHTMSYCTSRRREPESVVVCAPWYYIMYDEPFVRWGLWYTAESIEMAGNNWMFGKVGDIKASRIMNADIPSPLDYHAGGFDKIAVITVSRKHGDEHETGDGLFSLCFNGQVVEGVPMRGCSSAGIDDLSSSDGAAGLVIGCDMGANGPAGGDDFSGFGPMQLHRGTFTATEMLEVNIMWCSTLGAPTKEDVRI